MKQIQAIHCSVFQKRLTDSNKFGAIIHDIVYWKSTIRLILCSVFLCAWAWKFTKNFNFILLPGQAKCPSYSNFRSLTTASCRCFKKDYNRASREQIFCWRGRTRKFIGQRLTLFEGYWQAMKSLIQVEGKENVDFMSFWRSMKPTHISSFWRFPYN